MNRRIDPLSSQTLFRNPGNLLFRLSSTSWTVPDSTSTVSAPCVYFRRGAGITTLSDMVNTSEHFFECLEFGFDDLRRFKIEGVERFQAIPGDSEHNQVVGLDPALLNQFVRDADGHTAGGFAEHPFGFRKQLDSGDDL